VYRFSRNSGVIRRRFGAAMILHLTNRWSQPLVVVKSTSEFMKQFSMFTTLAVANGGSALSR
jgi:hypothetical protein